MAMVDRHRDANSEINRRYGSTSVGTLRAIYGGSFAAGFSPNAKLSDIIFYMNQYSLEQLAADHDAGKLDEKIHAKAAA